MQRLLAFGVWMLVSSYCVAENFGDWHYTIEDGNAVIVGYSGNGGEVQIPSEINSIAVTKVGNEQSPIFGLENTSVTKVIIPNGVTRIADRAFWEARGLQEVLIPSSVTSIGYIAFAVCLSLNNVIIPDSVTILGSEAFYRCSSLSSIKLSDYITVIKYSTFSLCDKLKQIHIPENIVSVEDYAFYGCASLVTISFPPNIQSIGRAFLNCPNLGGVYFEGNAPISTGTWDNSTGIILRSSASSGWSNSFAGLNVYIDTDDINNDGVSNVRALSVGLSPLFNLTSFINSLKTNPVSGLYNQTQYDANRTSGQNEVLSYPNSYGLYTTNQIHNLGLGGIILNRGTNNELTLHYQILESTDLVNWSTNSFLMPITNAPSDKMFLRVQAVGQ